MKNLRNIILTVFIVLGSIGSINCKHEDYNFPVAPIDLEDLIPVRVNSAASLAQRSNDDYNDNVNGLITDSTLVRWWQDWRGNRPSGITGKLVLIHTAIGDSSNIFVIPNESQGIYSYSLPNAMQILGETRSNGVLETIDMVPSGARFESILTRFGINPSRDMIVFIPDGVGTSQAFWMALRGWYTFRYWGVDGRNLAVLNGGVSNVIPGPIRSSRLSPEGLGTDYSVARRKVDNTILQSTLQDTMRYVDGRETYPTGIYIVDARTPAEYGALDRDGDPQWPNNTIRATPSSSFSDTNPEAIAFEGHIRGAVNLPFGNLLETSGSGQKFKKLVDIETEFSLTPGYERGKLVIPYCRTNVRAMVTGFASVAIIGNPTRFYDGSWIEWGSLSGRSGEGITTNLRANSPWRTDTATYTNNLSYNVPTGETGPSDLPVEVSVAVLPQAGSPPANSKVEQQTLSNFEIFARDTLRSWNEDKAFLRGAGGSGGGSRPGRPGNPCG